MTKLSDVSTKTQLAALKSIDIKLGYPLFLAPEKELQNTDKVFGYNESFKHKLHTNECKPKNQCNPLTVIKEVKRISENLKAIKTEKPKQETILPTRNDSIFRGLKNEHFIGFYELARIETGLIDTQLILDPETFYFLDNNTKTKELIIQNVGMWSIDDLKLKFNPFSEWDGQPITFNYGAQNYSTGEIVLGSFTYDYLMTPIALNPLCNNLEIDTDTLQLIDPKTNRTTYKIDANNHTWYIDNYNFVVFKLLHKEGISKSGEVRGFNIWYSVQDKCERQMCPVNIEVKFEIRY